VKEAQFYPFSQVPVSDSCWSLSTGPDGKIYAAVCIERRGGCSAYVARYNEVTDALDYLIEVGSAVGDPPHSGRATQCKIHYSFAPSQQDGIMYAATHLSGPALGDYIYNPWADWGDSRKAFQGAQLLAFDTQTDKILWHDLLIPGEGSRCLALDEARQLLYTVSYPRDHFLIYDLKTRTRQDLGRISSVNSQAIFLDRLGRAYTSNQNGQLLRYDPDQKKLKELSVFLPHEAYQSNFHSVIYDVVASPAGDCIYGVTWRAHPHLFRYWPEEGDAGRIEDLGPATQSRDRTLAISTFLDHAGGLVFGSDGNLYYGISRWKQDPGDISQNFGPDLNRIGKEIDLFGAEGIIVQLNPETLKKTDFAWLKREEMPAHYVSRGARNHNGDLFFGHVGSHVPAGMFKISMDSIKHEQQHLPLRTWG